MQLHRPALSYLLVLVGLVGCNTFTDLEEAHPFGEGENSEPATDACDECDDDESCLNGECIPSVQDPCARCTDAQTCVEDQCVDPTDPCDEGVEPDCSPSTCEENPDPHRCLDTKECPDGSQIPADEVCDCVSEDGEDRCCADDDECLECRQLDPGCECTEDFHCPGDAMCSAEGVCVPDEQITFCTPANQNTNCERCHSAASPCPDGYDCADEEGVCYPVICGALDDTMPNGTVCVHSCGMTGECPGEQECIDQIYCISTVCRCPTDYECSLSDGDPVCRDADGRALECEVDDDCDPAICVRGLCIGN